MKEEYKPNYNRCYECGIRIAPRWYFQELPAHKILCDHCHADSLGEPEKDYWD